MLRRHSASRPVVGAAAAFLARTGSSRPSSLQIILAKAAVPDVIHAIQVIDSLSPFKLRVVTIIWAGCS